MSIVAPAQRAKVAIIGGGLAGLAAAVALADRECEIVLFEARRQLGGRATSFFDSASRTWIDHCQHVSLGCCTNLADFCTRTGLSELIETHKTLHFFGPGGERCDLTACKWLPAPLHLFPALARLQYLSWRERWSVMRGLRALARSANSGEAQGLTIDQWLRAYDQTDRAIKLFWEPVIVSALSESIDRAAVPPVRKVFVDGFMAHRRGYEMQIPCAPLGEFYGLRLQTWLNAHKIQLRLQTSVKQIIGDANGIRELELEGGERFPCDAVIVAVPWRRVGEMISTPLRAALPELNGIEQLESAPITAVHLWFDKPITSLPHAVLPGRTSQWMFNRGVQPLDGTGSIENANGYYLQIVISASREFERRPREQIVNDVVAELKSIWPDAAAAKLLSARMITEQHAVFSVRPGSDQHRPPQRTAIRNLFLAGDWTATGWPATMEGAVRSGYLAAEGVLSLIGRSEKLLVDDLPRSWLVRWLIR
ncbi:MAG TPA: hydroxysqualene dehydroxylase HpnE [Pirellulales bacterium]